MTVRDCTFITHAPLGENHTAAVSTDAPLANQLEATREKAQAPSTLIFSRWFQSRFGGACTSDRGGSFGRQTDDTMHAEPDRRTETNHDVHEPLSSREYVQCTFECAMHIDSTRDAFAGGGGL